MMGERIEDPAAMESERGSANGLGLLPVSTVLASEKVTRRVRAVTPSGLDFDAYEIHLGVTIRPPDAIPFAVLHDSANDGVRMGRCIGTYLHGALEDPRVLSELLGRRIAPLPSREETYEMLADWFEANVNRKVFEEMYLCSR
jgi:adenosylcobyric acid synthase